MSKSRSLNLLFLSSLLFVLGTLGPTVGYPEARPKTWSRARPAPFNKAVTGTATQKAPAASSAAVKKAEVKEAPRYPYRTVISNGPPEEKFDLVFVSDGFAASERPRFDSRVNSCLRVLWGLSPYSDLRNRFNVHVVYVDSPRAQSWDSRGGRDQSASPFGTKDSDSLNTIRITDKGVAQATEAARSAPEADAVVVLTTKIGRSFCSIGSIIVLSDGQDDAVGHELGHFIGALGDEYYSSEQFSHDEAMHALPSQADLQYPNLQMASQIDLSSPATIRQTAKWSHWIKSTDSGVVSAYEGGFYRSRGVYRPSNRCHMRDHKTTKQFCPVCHETLYKAILKKAHQEFDDGAYHGTFALSDWSALAGPRELAQGGRPDAPNALVDSELRNRVHRWKQTKRQRTSKYRFKLSQQRYLRP